MESSVFISGVKDPIAFAVLTISFASLFASSDALIPSIYLRCSACPGALVPTLIPVDPKTGQPDESKSVYESIVTIEYIDMVSGATGKDRLISDDPFFYARSRVWADKVNRECCSTYYGVLVRKDEAERKENFENLVKGLEVGSVFVVSVWFLAQQHKQVKALFAFSLTF